MPSSAEEFLTNLRKSNLLSTRQWDDLLWHLEGCPEPRKKCTEADLDSGRWPAISLSAVGLANRLVEKTWLTRWQADMLLAGKKAFFLGKYRLLDCIGSGGMGAVFKASDRGLKREVAIKLMSPAVVKDRRAVARFHKEIQAVAALNHPNIVAAYDADSVGNVHFLVMEYVDGQDLGQLVSADGPLPVGWACECIRQAAEGLQHAHEKGMIHRDVKPTNLLVTTDSENKRPLVKILDLGLARFVSETAPREPAPAKKTADDGSLTQIGQVMGTPDYIAPEQADDTRRADIRSDIFSLGCTLFRLLTGKLPYPGETVVEKLDARLKQDAVRVRSFRQEIPDELDAVVSKMLARKPENRYQTAREVAQALAPFSLQIPIDRWLKETRRDAGEDGPRRQRVRSPEEDTRLNEFFVHLGTQAAEDMPSTSPWLANWERVGTRSKIGLAAGVIVLLIAFGIWKSPSPSKLTIVWPIDERNGGTLEVDARPMVLPPSEQIVIFVAGKSLRIKLTRNGFEPIEQQIRLDRGESDTWTPTWKPTKRTIRRSVLATLEKRVETATGYEPLSQDAKLIRGELLEFSRANPATEESQSAVRLRSHLRWPLDLLSREKIPADELRRAGLGNPTDAPADLVAVFGNSRMKFWNRITSISASFNGKLIAAASLDGTVRIIDATTGNDLHYLRFGPDPLEVKFSPADLTLAVGGGRRDISLWNAVSGETRGTLTGAEWPMAFSTDGKLLAARAGRHEISLWNVAGPDLRRTMQGHAAGVIQSLTFSPNGLMLASSSSDDSVMLWDVASGQERRRYSRAHAPQFSPDSGFLAVGGANRDLELWDTRTGEVRHTLDEAGNPLGFAGDGKTLISYRPGRAIVWNMTTGDEIRTILEVPEVAAVTPNGKFLAAGDADEGFKLWSVTTGEVIAAQEGSTGVEVLATARDSAGIVVGGTDHVVRLWDTATGQEQLKASPPILAADLSPDGMQLAVRLGNRLEIRNVVSEEVVVTLHGSADDITTVGFSPDGRLIAGFGGWGFFRLSLRLWDAATGLELPLGSDQSGTVRTMAFSLNGNWLATAGDSRVATLWELSERTLSDSIDDFPDRIVSLAIHPEGGVLAAGSVDRTITLWDLKSKRGKTIRLEQTPQPGELEFSPDGKTLVVGISGGEVALLDLAAGRLRGRIPGPSTDTATVRLVPDGHRLFFAGNEGKIDEWTLIHQGRRPAEPGVTLQIGPDRGLIRRIYPAPDGRHLITLNGNGTVYVLRIEESRNVRENDR